MLTSVLVSQVLAQEIEQEPQDEDPNDPNCQATCELEEGLADDDCYAEGTAFLNCAAPGCEVDDYIPCGGLFSDWDLCSPGELEP